MNTQSPQVKIYNFLRKHDLATIGTLNRKKQPILAAVYYYIDDEYNLYFVTKTNTRKYRNLKDNPAVGVVVVDEKKRFTVSAEGLAKEVSDEDAQVNIMNELAKVRGDSNSAWFPPIAQIDGGTYVLIKVDLRHVTMADYANFKHDGSDVIETVVG
jgi:nitroimidazol reductase NimA-like FMN-containing flavoprotein (pyridoxamine 5'-phosphate oxidase superfamily)